jgi:uncharacterized protein YukE
MSARAIAELHPTDLTPHHFPHRKFPHRKATTRSGGSNMAFEGMDVDEVTSIWNQMNNLLSQLDQVCTTMPGLVSQLEGAWKGPDAQMFASQWPGHQTQLTTAAAGLRDMVTHTHVNLQQQISASNSY